MRLTVVGCSGSFPGTDSSASCYLVEAEGHRVVLDLGNGALGALARHVSVHDIDAVLLSHLHPDHFFDVCSLYVARHYDPNGRRPGLPVYGPSSTQRRLSEAYGPGSRSGMAEQFEFKDWEDGGSYDVGPLHVTVRRVAHPIEAFGMRIEHDGRVLTYSGDTGPSEALVELARGADLFLCEASAMEGRTNPPNLHLTGKQAAEAATRAGAHKLVLTHIPPWNDADQTLAEAAPVFAGDLVLARAGAAHEV